MRAVKLYDNNQYGYLIVSEGPPMRFKGTAHTFFPKKQNYSYMGNTRSFTEFLSFFFHKMYVCSDQGLACSKNDDLCAALIF